MVQMYLKKRLKSIFTIYLPSIALLIFITTIEIDYTINLLWIALPPLLLFTIQSYIQFQVKYRQSIFVYVIPVTFLSVMYYVNVWIDLIQLIITSELIYTALVLRGNWNSSDIYLGRVFKKQELKNIRKGTIKRIKKMNFNEQMLIEFLSEFNRFDRDILLKEEYLKKKTPEMGLEVISNKYRTKKGNELLQKAKDVLFACLYGDEVLNVNIERVENELLTITMSRLKAYTLQPYMKAVTELGGKGTWFDIENISHDHKTDNVILEVEYREVASEMVGNAIKSTLDLINLLEINEKILYLRMMNIEQSSL